MLKNNHTISVLLMASLLGFGCSKGGDVQVSRGKEENHFHLEGERPRISAEEAAKLLTQEPQGTKQNEVRARIELNPSFDWETFWVLLKNESPETLSSMSDFILTLRPSICRDSLGYESTVLSLTESNLEDSALLAFFKEQPDACKNRTLKVGTSLKIYARLGSAYTKSTDNKVKNEIAGFVVQHFIHQTELRSIKESSSRESAESLIAHFPSATWIEFLDRSGKEQAFQLLTNLSQHRLSISKHLTNKLVRPIFEDPLLISKLNEEIGIDLTLDTLLNFSSQYRDEIPKEQRLGILNQILAIYQVEIANAPMGLESIESTWKRFNKSIQIFTDLTSSRDQPALLLQWYGNMQRSTEDLFAKEEETALLFLENKDRTSVDGAWFKYRALKKKDRLQKAAVEANFDFDADDEGSFKNVLLARLMANLHPSEETFADYCLNLERIGIKKSSYPLEKFIESPAQILQSIGCIQIEIDSDQVGKHYGFKLDPIQIPYDNLLQLPGVNLNIDVPSIDGGLFDLSATQKHPQLKAPIAPDEFNALAVPVVAGYYDQHGNTTFSKLKNRKNTIYFFVVHVPVQIAQQGLLSKEKPLAGLAGGTLTLNLDESRKSILPVFISNGGEGQKGAPQGEGGKSDQYTLNSQKIQEWFDLYDLTNKGVNESYASQNFLYSGTNAEIIRELRTESSMVGSLPIELSSEAPIGIGTLFVYENLYINMSVYDRVDGPLTSEMLNRIEFACRKLGGISKKCFEQLLGPLTMKTIDESIAGKISETPAEFFPDEFSLPAGEKSAVNPDGEPGEDGKMMMNGEEI